MIFDYVMLHIYIFLLKVIDFFINHMVLKMNLSYLPTVSIWYSNIRLIVWWSAILMHVVLKWKQMKNMVHVLSELFFANYFRSFKLLISGFFLLISQQSLILSERLKRWRGFIKEFNKWIHNEFFYLLPIIVMLFLTKRH